MTTAMEKDELVTSWKTEIPVSIIGFDYGDFIESVENAPGMKLTAYAGRVLPDELRSMETGYATMTIMGDGRRDSGLVRGGLNTASTVKHAASMSIQAFKLFEFLFGTLPFKALSVVQQQTGGGSSGWPNLIFLPYTTLLDATMQNQLGMQQSGEQREFSRIVAVHEMARQWWEHFIGAKTYHDQWLLDGGADFASSMYLRQFEPGELNDFKDMRRRWLLSNNSSGYRPLDAGPPWLNIQLNEYNERGTSALATRYKGWYIMEMLRALMVDPKLKNPDGHFITMMRDFTGTYSGKNASTEEFRRTVEKHVGRSMGWFFEQWVYGTEMPTYDFSYKISDAEAGQADISITLAQSGVSDAFQMQLPLYAVVSGQRRYIGLIGTRGTKPLQTSVRVAMRPEKLLLDPERSILAEIHQ